MRVLILSSQSTPRGVLRALPALGVDPIVALPGGESETEGLVQFVRVTARGDAADPMDLRWSRRSLRAVLRDVRPDLIHIVGDPQTPTAEVGASAARDLEIPYALVRTSSVGGPKGITARWQADKVRDGAAALAGAVRPALDALTQGTSDKPTAVLPPGGISIPSQPEIRPVSPPVVFAAVGRLLPERGIDLLLDALGQTYGDWRLRIIGTGPVQEELEAQSQRLGLSSRIEWLGTIPRDQLAGQWSSIDVLVAPSRSKPEWVEPTGSVVLEAMAHCVAPIVSRCGALPDVVGDSGLVVDEDDGAALARALHGLVEEPDRCRTVGLEARQRVLERYSDGAVAERMVQFWDRAVKRTSTPAAN